jgi:hypothetical protein
LNEIAAPGKPARWGATTDMVRLVVLLVFSLFLLSTITLILIELTNILAAPNKSCGPERPEQLNCGFELPPPAQLKI